MSDIDYNYCCLCRDSEGSDPIYELHIMSYDATVRARMISHPVESGGVVFDNKVIDPAQLSLKCKVYWSDKHIIDELLSMLRNRTYQFYSFVGHDGIYKNLSCISCPISRTPELYDVFNLNLTFQEVMFGVNRETKQSDVSNSPSLRSGRIGGAIGW